MIVESKLILPQIIKLLVLSNYIDLFILFCVDKLTDLFMFKVIKSNYI